MRGDAAPKAGIPSHFLTSPVYYQLGKRRARVHLHFLPFRDCLRTCSATAAIKASSFNRDAKGPPPRSITARSSALICVWYGGAFGRLARFLKNLMTSSSSNIETRALAGLDFAFFVVAFTGRHYTRRPSSVLYI
jgi:hypothetical protein